MRAGSISRLHRHQWGGEGFGDRDLCRTAIRDRQLALGRDVAIKFGEMARVADPQTREPIWTAWKTAYPGFADYERKTTRQIPVVILEPVR